MAPTYNVNAHTSNSYVTMFVIGQQINNNVCNWSADHQLQHNKDFTFTQTSHF